MCFGHTIFLSLLPKSTGAATGAATNTPGLQPTLLWNLAQLTAHLLCGDRVWTGSAKDPGLDRIRTGSRWDPDRVWTESGHNWIWTQSSKQNLDTTRTGWKMSVSVDQANIEIKHDLILASGKWAPCWEGSKLNGQAKLKNSDHSLVCRFILYQNTNNARSVQNSHPKFVHFLHRFCFSRLVTTPVHPAWPWESPRRCGMSRSLGQSASD